MVACQFPISSVSENWQKKSCKLVLLQLIRINIFSRSVFVCVLPKSVTVVVVWSRLKSGIPNKLLDVPRTLVVERNWNIGAIPTIIIQIRINLLQSSWYMCRILLPKLSLILAFSAPQISAGFFNRLSESVGHLRADLLLPVEMLGYMMRRPTATLVSKLVCGLDKLRMRKLLRLFVHQLLRQVNVLLVGHHLGLAMMVVRLHIFNMPGYLVHQLHCIVPGTAKQRSMNVL